MSDQDEQYEKSWILHHILDRYIGSREMVATRRKLRLIQEQIRNCEQKGKKCLTGSSVEGMEMEGSDMDVMYIMSDVIVICPDQYTGIPPNNFVEIVCPDQIIRIPVPCFGDTDETVLIMRDTDCRPGYVTVELIELGQSYYKVFDHCIEHLRDVNVLSSEKYARYFVDFRSVTPMAANGPAATATKEETSFGLDIDRVSSLRCSSWPREANEWVSRPRLYEWPDEGLRSQVVLCGCYLVPVGDKTSDYSHLQWRISFTTAERKLIYSLTHTQFLIYGLFKYFLKQIANSLEQIMGKAGIISSYIIKTVIFHAVESTPVSLWQEKNTFFCFMLCLKILIAWVKAGHCPNYFISSNNMFHGKVCDENQQKLLRFLIELHDMKWECLSVGTFIQPSIGTLLNRVRNGHLDYVLPTPKQSEMEIDSQIFHNINSIIPKSASLPMLTGLLSKSTSDIDEFIDYIYTATALSFIGVDTFEKHVAAKGNKEKYKFLRKSKNLMKPFSSVCTSPGLLMLAIFYYQTGNYSETLEICGLVSKIYFDKGSILEDKDRYEHLYCGRGYTLLHKFQEVYVSSIKFKPNRLKFCPSQLHIELRKRHERNLLLIPPLPFAVFLSFLCYHELGDNIGRSASLRNLRAVKYDEEQGGRKHWIVHNLLGICYEMVGDTHRALREYTDSPCGPNFGQNENPAKERIERLQHS
ncbi:uncharacterized protein LOC110448335 [Mizuhopecten yessoensis]|uniref:Cyclic GMP-AMP synthase n=1 Tax=Mizuhopecten yessoensis TaxID=6573 RepID=A0A210R5T9_MIZYE|nr:uncharacterized protein LOC110448335 [Mizuhopecten yessoensis]XP_021350199.1 uncharacterized protein LOC110448335 [Mizuhopecten yessoensis]OWF56392.1 Cyclic GMP-AMP synthase [Mizuhopecten yessoensis]